MTEGQGCCGGGHSHGAQEQSHSASGHSHGTGVAAEVKISSIEITSQAAAKIKAILASEGKPVAEYGLRLGVQGGGCSGLSYMMDLDTSHDGDKVFEKDGVRVIVDPKSILYVSGSVLDYKESLQGSGFSLKNPNVKGSCGCGSSFSV